MKDLYFFIWNRKIPNISILTQSQKPLQKCTFIWKNTASSDLYFFIWTDLYFFIWKTEKIRFWLFSIFSRLTCTSWKRPRKPGAQLFSGMVCGWCGAVFDVVPERRRAAAPRPATAAPSGPASATGAGGVGQSGTVSVRVPEMFWFALAGSNSF